MVHLSASWKIVHRDKTPHQCDNCIMWFKCCEPSTLVMWPWFSQQKVFLFHQFETTKIRELQPSPFKYSNKKNDIPYCKRPSLGRIGCKNSSLSHGRGGVRHFKLSGGGLFNKKKKIAWEKIQRNTNLWKVSLTHVIQLFFFIYTVSDNCKHGSVGRRPQGKFM